MATHASADDPGPASLPETVPFDLRQLTRQSWKLGSRIVEDAERFGTWAHTGGGWTLAAFEATDETLILQLRTPVGRSRFYGATRAEFRNAVPRLTSSPDWERAEQA
ncbi:hypothetical protein JCM30237_23430 [Halolamina litorea]|uniref:Uncharacterized protein n=1 Tax=Halolamina litorea TaxID=1515593 RepID=A0ABD6BRE8_9EURY|nr:hypothetical protein [Halolamina litorea]